MLHLRKLRKPLRFHLHISTMLKMWNLGTVILFPYQIRHKLVELFGAKTNLIVVYVLDYNFKRCSYLILDLKSVKLCIKLPPFSFLQNSKDPLTVMGKYYKQQHDKHLLEKYSMFVWEIFYLCSLLPSNFKLLLLF